MVAKVTLTQTTTIFVEAPTYDDVQNWANQHTPAEAFDLGGHTEYSEWVEEVHPQTTPSVVLGGKSYINVKVDGCTYTCNFSPDVTRDHFFTAVAKRICFADCTGEEVTKIVFHDKEYFYRGWRRDMLFSFMDGPAGKEIWRGRFPNWEH